MKFSFPLNLRWKRTHSSESDLNILTDRVYRYRSPLTFSPIERNDAFAGKEGVYIEPPGTDQKFVMRSPACHDDPDGAGIFSNFPNHAVTYAPRFLLSLQNIHLVGCRTALTAEGSFVSDRAYVEQAQLNRDVSNLAMSDEFANEYTGLVKSVDDGGFKLKAGDRPIIPLDCGVVVLCSLEPSNYGSFLFRTLPKLAGLGDTPPGFKYLAYTNIGTMQDFMILNELPADRIIPHDPRAIYHIKHAIVPCLKNPEGFLDPPTLAFYADMRRRFGAPTRHRKIYISRRRANAQSARVMLNEPAVIDAVKSIGFEVVEPETLPARHQVELFSSASFVVGPAGSGLFNAVFCHPGTRLIDIESQPDWIHAHRCLFGSLNLRYCIFEGKKEPTEQPPPHQPFTVNVDALVKRINDFPD
jgi:capsular polysaccharide biosynthesis protein